MRYIGLSECGVDTLRRAAATFPISAYQIEYSPFSMDIEKMGVDLAKTCRELGIGIVAYCPLGRGMLTGQYKSPEDFAEGDFRRAVPRFSKDHFSKNMKLVDDIAAIASRKGCTPGQLTLAWMMKQEGVFPIPGTKRIAYLEENVAANGVYAALTDDEASEIRQAVEKAEVYGTRYPEMMMGGLVKDTPPRE